MQSTQCKHYLTRDFIGCQDEADGWSRLIILRCVYCGEVIKLQSRVRIPPKTGA